MRINNYIAVMLLAISVIYTVISTVYAPPSYRYGCFHGYLVVYTERPNLNNTKLLQGTFHDDLISRQQQEIRLGRSGTGIPVLLDHNYDQVIGKFTELNEDSHGLAVKGKVDLSLVKGRETWHLMKTGVLTSMSYGLTLNTPAGAYRYENKEILVIEKAHLLEGSIVSVPAEETAQLIVDKECE